MKMNNKEVRLIPSGQEASEQRALEAPHDLSIDVRSTVEGQFRKMEQAHDRIRNEELAARLAAHTIN